MFGFGRTQLIITLLVAIFFAFLSFKITNSIRMHQIKNLKQELELAKQEKERLTVLLKQCQTDLNTYTQAYQDLTTQLKQKELDYAKRLKTYADEVRRLNIAQKYNIQVPYSNDTCSNLMHILDRLAEVEKQ
ncbi:MAG: hypothetical protein QXX30_01935 [Candidatus Aenigmatarchaeota archaeon]